ncbi:FAA hydrolase family protein [Flagellimonas taeanensis]|uniref:fumarylacetoacetate hydrolase family protein n=1 Tax=Flavobacteriaceae TaxID=49546 RepID=UPI000E6A694F|nr:MULTISPECIES: fumarylacetoacetate hydrolase family protein [Allomuricauda]MDC6386982.1 fumarylacetoacetate hydrolase family protein [Muricauda sp. SK9]RIV51478.1 FAA hydrolase family protein [Allomuricauda taeanensis]
MKLIRYGKMGMEKPGILINDKRYSLSAYFKDFDRDFFATDGLAQVKELLSRGEDLPLVGEEERWGAPIARPGKVMCIGLNYSDHAKEAGMPIPAEPIIFQKGSNTVVGPYDPILIPRGSEKTDWEVELGVVIGKRARYLDSIEASKDCIAGYCLANDVSERAFQLERGGQWTKGKSSDNFTPIGPFLLDADRIENPQDLDMKLWVNGQLMQSGNTDNMIFSVHFIVHYLSQFMTLEEGDLILTGTPPGVGMGQKPQVYLKLNDVVELEVEHLGRQKQICHNA